MSVAAAAIGTDMAAVAAMPASTRSAGEMAARGRAILSKSAGFAGGSALAGPSKNSGPLRTLPPSGKPAAHAGGSSSSASAPRAGTAPIGASITISS